MSDRKQDLRSTQDIGGMTRRQVVHELMHFDGAVKLDFTAEFVAEQSLDELKHILAAARMHIGLCADRESPQPSSEPRVLARAD